MSGSNHIVGGIAFTGIVGSFFDINLYSSPILILTCCFFSLLPDIDHTKSLIGKICYPIAYWLGRRYGHRTITHSLLFLGSTFLFLAIIKQTGYIDSKTMTVANIALASHLIFDMLTVQGIPFFYPFMRNPCVIPANPKLRFPSKSTRHELFFLGFTMLIFTSSFSLVKDGFWTTLNKKINSVRALESEFRNSKNLLYVSFQYRENLIQKKSSGYLLSIRNSHITLWDDSVFILIEEPRSVSNIQFETTEIDNIERYIKTESHDTLPHCPCFFASISSEQKFSLIADDKIVHDYAYDGYYINNLSVFTKTKNERLTDYRLKILEMEVELEELNVTYRDAIATYQAQLAAKDSLTTLLTKETQAAKRAKLRRTIFQNSIQHPKKPNRATFLEKQIRSYKSIVAEIQTPPKLLIITKKIHLPPFER